MEEEKLILKIEHDEQGNLVVEIPDTDNAVMAVATHVWDGIRKKDQRALDILFSMVTHFLAQDISGNIEKQFIKNLKEVVPEYRAQYATMARQLRKPKS